jgi:hypothetical protein
MQLIFALEPSHILYSLPKMGYHGIKWINLGLYGKISLSDGMVKENGESG